MGVAGHGWGDDQGAARGRSTGPNPTNRGKKGTKRSLLTHGTEVPLALVVDGASRNDFRLARQTLESLPIERPQATETAPQALCLDKGYDYDEVRAPLGEFGYTGHIRSRGEEAQALKQELGHKARRWVVEHTHSGMNRFRRLLVRWERKLKTFLGFLHLACAHITFAQAGLLG